MDIWGNRWAAFIWVEIQLEKIKPMNDNRLVPIQYFLSTVPHKQHKVEQAESQTKNTQDVDGDEIQHPNQTLGALWRFMNPQGRPPSISCPQNIYIYNYIVHNLFSINLLRCCNMFEPKFPLQQGPTCTRCRLCTFRAGTCEALKHVGKWLGCWNSKLKPLDFL